MELFLKESWLPNLMFLNKIVSDYSELNGRQLSSHGLARDKRCHIHVLLIYYPRLAMSI